MKLQEDLNSLSGVELAIKHLNGKAYALANLCGVSQQAVSLRRKKGVIPPERVNLVSGLLGIPREKLNPIFEPTKVKKSHA